MSKDILKDALEDVLNESFNEMTGLDIPDYDFSDEFRDKMEKLTASPEKRSEKKRKGILWISVSALTAAAAAFCVWTGLRNTPQLSTKDNNSGIITSVEEPTEGTSVSIQTTSVCQADSQTTTIVSSEPVSAVTTYSHTQSIPQTVTQNGISSVSQSQAPITNHSVTVATTTGTHHRPTLNTTAANTSLPAQVVTTVTSYYDPELNEQLDEYERSLIMKKFLAVSAAAASMLSVSPTHSMAVYEAPKVSERFSAYFENIDSGLWNADVDGNGTFEAQDIYKIYRYILNNEKYASKEEELAVKEAGDINKNGMTNLEDVKILEKYYFYKYGFDPEDFDISLYKDNSDRVTIDSYNFIEEMKSVAESDDLLYQYAAEKIKNGDVDLDVNSDGNIDIMDAFDYYVYFCKNYYSGMDVLIDNIKDYDSVFKKSEDVFAAFDYDRNSDSTIVKYFIYNCDFSPEWLNVNIYYDHFHKYMKQSPNTSNYPLYSKYEFVTRSFSYLVKDAALEAGLATVRDDTAKIDLLVNPEFGPKFDELFAQYDSDVMNGLITPPDINHDGSVDFKDRDVLVQYMYDVIDYKTAEDSTIDYNTWTYIDTQLDLNDNGVYGDLYDLWLPNQLIMKYGEDTLTEKLNEYNANQENQKKISKLGHIRYLEAKSGVNLQRSGDADGDSNVKMNDAVLVMQSISNPDRFQLDDWGEFNADLYNTGDGITPMDALEIQNQLLLK
ncbi:MAG: hypothetical protein IKI56_09185 [Ruminococcus sp.]|nr:hypothetical protein [Ruminococcus sp.]